MENFSERLFCDLKNAGIKIENPTYSIGGAKLGQFLNSQQLNIFGMRNKYMSGKGITFSDNEESFKLAFTEAYNEFLFNVKSMGNHIKFYSLVIPKNGVVEVRQLEYETVVARYIKDYLPHMDEILERWDVMVGKAD